MEISENEAVEFQKIYGEQQQKITLVPEIERLLEFLYEKGKQLALLTNGPHEHQLMKIKQLGLTRWIPEDHIFISSAIGFAKPAREAFGVVEKSLLLTREKTVYIGDSFENDVVGAKQAGWKSIWMNHRRKEIPNTSVLPDKIVHTHGELLDLLGNKGTVLAFPS